MPSCRPRPLRLYTSQSIRGLFERIGLCYWRYAADLGNKRIQVFDADGTFKSQFGGVGVPMALCITSGATQYLYVSHVGDQSGMDDATIYKVQLDGKVVGRFGSAGKLPKEFGVANSIDCRSENDLLIGEMSNWRIQRVTLKR